MFWPPHSRSGGGQGPETFLAPSADKQTGEHDQEMDSSGSHQSAQTASSELCVVQQWTSHKWDSPFILRVLKLQEQWAI